MTDQEMELFVLNSSAPNQLVVLARRGPDIALSRLQLDHPEIQSFIQFNQIVEQVTLGGVRPTDQDVDSIGDRLFNHVFNGDVLRLYNRSPHGPISIQIITDEPNIQRIPWEFMRTVDRRPVPYGGCCIVRILPMCAPVDPAPSKSVKKLRVLLAVADPLDQDGVPWDDVEHSLRHSFETQTGDAATLKVIPGATRQSLLHQINSNRFDVFHFLGHGGVIDGVGRLILVDVDTKKSDYITAEEIARALSSAKGLKLAILSACLSGSGNFKDDFGPVASALLRAGIPAVVANQTSIPTKSVAPFVSSLYQKLLLEGNIDAAVMSGRIALKDGLRENLRAAEAANADAAIIEWGIPVLYRLPSGAQLFFPRENDE